MAKGVSSVYTEKHIQLIREYPHLMGHIAGRDKLTELHSDWIKYIWTSGKSVSLNAHRGSYKSTALIHVGVPWYLLFNPDARICIVRKTYADAADAVATIGKVMEQPEIRELFYFCHGEYPNFRVRREGKIDFTFKKTKTPEGSVTGFGLNSPLTGRHFDFILCDDISTLKDRLSKAEREYTKQIWRELMTNIIDRGKPCCYSGTPWHRDGVESIIPTPKQYTLDDCNLITPEQLEHIRANTTPSLFAANYELKFVADDDALFKDPKYDKWRDKDIGTVYAHIDAAYGGEDYCALTIGARRKEGPLQYVGFAYSGNIKDWLPQIDKYLRLFRVRKTAVEMNSDKGWTSSMLKQLGHSVLEYTEGTQKQHKIGTYLYEVWPNVLWDPCTDDDYMTQIVDWTAETKEHDDACFAKDTLIQTSRGSIPIQDVKVGDFAWTPLGFRRILHAGVTGIRPVITNIGLSGTKDHKVYNEPIGSFTSLECCAKESVSKLNLKEMLLWERRKEFFLMDTGMPAHTREDIISARVLPVQKEKEQSNCTQLFGNSTTKGKNQRDMRFTIKTAIRIITIFLIWNYLRFMNIVSSTRRFLMGIGSTVRIGKNNSTLVEKKQRNGILAPKDWHGIKNMLKLPFVKGKSLPMCASIAETPTRRNLLGKSTVVPLAIKSHACLLILKRFVLFAASHLRRAKVNEYSAGISARAETADVPVYNLTVEGAGVYYANGILVSNCDSAASITRAFFSKKAANSERWKW